MAPSARTSPTHGKRTCSPFRRELMKRPISCARFSSCSSRITSSTASPAARSEEHTSELQSQSNLVCRLLLEKKKNIKNLLVPHPRLQLHLIRQPPQRNLIR